MTLVFSERAWEDYLHWQKQDHKALERVNQLIREIRREPFSGKGGSRLRPLSEQAGVTNPHTETDITHVYPWHRGVSSPRWR